MVLFHIMEYGGTVNLGERLRFCRTRLQWTLSDVRIRTGVGESSLSDFENGKREPTLGQLRALADAYQRTLSFFFEEAPPCRDVILWRKRPDKGVEEIESTFLRLCEQYHNLERWTGDVRTSRLPQFRIAADDFGYPQARTLARNFRNAMQLGDHPALSLLSVLEEACGVKIFHLSFDPSGTAACAKSARFGSAILLNARNKRWRRNFDLAHELFHLLTWDLFSPADLEAEAGAKVEKLATCFARNLLMPWETVESVVESRLQDGKLGGASIFDIAREFDVSAEALVRHLGFEWRLGGERTEKMLQVTESRRALLEDRADSPPPSYPDRYRALAVHALNRGELSLGRFAGYLGISRQKAELHLDPETANHEAIPVPPA